ncbi:MAG: Unknown protein, partial [uncultured Sulfurovum sp.]
RLKKSLEDLDFTVTVEKNLNSEYLSEAIEQFSKRLAKDKNNIGFLYYSGHGCQLNHQGYLVPTDVDTKNRVKIKHHALSINEMLDTLSMANNRVNMLFLDACRDVPTGTRGGTKGLGQLTSRPKGSLVVYATEAGKTAEDNSNFIDALIENIQQPNQNVKDIADNISNAVADKTGEKQIPVVFYKRLPEVVLHRLTTPIMPIKVLSDENSRIIKMITLIKKIDKILLKNKDERVKNILEKYKKIIEQYLIIISSFAAQKSKCQNLENIYKEQQRNQISDRQLGKDVVLCYKVLETSIYNFDDMNKNLENLRKAINTLQNMVNTLAEEKEAWNKKLLKSPPYNVTCRNPYKNLIYPIPSPLSKKII